MKIDSIFLSHSDWLYWRMFRMSTHKSTVRTFTERGQPEIPDIWPMKNKIKFSISFSNLKF